MDTHKVIYQWSEDGDREICTREDFTAHEQGLCYHCDNSIKTGDKISILTAPQGYQYRMHSECADKGCAGNIPHEEAAKLLDLDEWSKFEFTDDFMEGGRIRQGEAPDRSKYRNKKLKDFLEE